jgi:hypothetical protein
MEQSCREAVSCSRFAAGYSKFPVGVQGRLGIDAVFSQGKRLCTIAPLHSNRRFALAAYPGLQLLDKKHVTLADGLPLEEIDDRSNGEYDSAITIEIKQFLIVFKCNAESAADLATMTKSVRESSHLF